jgi:hypothetical protein
MRDEIAEIIKKNTRYDNPYWRSADQILTLLNKRVEKAALTNQELLKLCGVNDGNRMIAQAQLNKVLEVLK